MYNFYLVLEINQEGKFYATVRTITQCDNIQNILQRVSGCVCAYIAASKKDAWYQCAWRNAHYKACGVSAFELV